ESAPGVSTCLVVARTRGDVTMRSGRDVYYHDASADQSDDPATCPCESMDAEDLLFLMYTSGTTSRPKGIKHTTAGYLVGVATTHHFVFDIKPDTVYWCAADIGWITGHSYIVYGPLCNGVTSVLYEGTPDYPDKDRWWDIVERYGVTGLDTAPTAIRTHMKWGPEYAEARPVLIAGVGQRGRTDQPRGVGVVPQPHRRWSYPGRGHVVADRNGHDHDQPVAGGLDVE